MKLNTRTRHDDKHTWSITKHNTMPLNTMTQCLTALSIMTLIIMPLSITAIHIMITTPR
jgi:hypothetical protein